MKKRINEAKGPSQRQLRVGELIRRELAGLLARGDHFEPALEGRLISVSEVQVSPDLRVATVYVYPYGGDDGDVILTLNSIAPRLRTKIAHNLNLKYSAELRFVLDEVFDNASSTLAKIDALEIKDE